MTKTVYTNEERLPRKRPSAKALEILIQERDWKYPGLSNVTMKFLVSEVMSFTDVTFGFQGSSKFKATAYRVMTDWFKMFIFGIWE